MATIGVSKPYYAKYNYENGNVSYSGGGIMGKMTELDIEIETSEDNNLYGDNGVAETDRMFSGGTVTASTTDLSQEVSRDILGLTEEDLEKIPGVTDTGVKELLYDDTQATPYLGCGFIIKKNYFWTLFRNKKRKAMFNNSFCNGLQFDWCSILVISVKVT